MFLKTGQNKKTVGRGRSERVCSKSRWGWEERSGGEAPCPGADPCCGPNLKVPRLAPSQYDLAVFPAESPRRPFLSTRVPGLLGYVLLRLWYTSGVRESAHAWELTCSQASRLLAKALWTAQWRSSQIQITLFWIFAFLGKGFQVNLQEITTWRKIEKESMTSPCQIEKVLPCWQSALESSRNDFVYSVNFCIALIPKRAWGLGSRAGRRPLENTVWLQLCKDRAKPNPRRQTTTTNNWQKIAQNVKREGHIVQGLWNQLDLDFNLSSAIYWLCCLGHVA